MCAGVRRARRAARCLCAVCLAGVTGRNLPLHRMAQNRIWLEIVQIALGLLTRMPMLALTGKARLWGPRRLRLRGRTARDHRPLANPPPGPALALDRSPQPSTGSPNCLAAG